MDMGRMRVRKRVPRSFPDSTLHRKRLGESNFIHETKGGDMNAGAIAKVIGLGIGLAAVAFVGWVIFNSVTSFLPG